jgi:RNA polymerase subunit RPABC4/transcription elongation factor Spt4
MNNDLISREALKKRVDEVFYNDEIEFKDLIDNAPTVEERPHGEWIKHIDDLYPEDSTEECPFCHEEQRLVGNDDNFCPNCGADMRGGKQ